MPAYLFPCPCGQQLEVEAGEAGQAVRCPHCKAQHELPSLRLLRQLPPAPGSEQTSDDKGGSGPSPAAPQPEAGASRRNLGSVLLLLSLLALAVLLYLRVTTISGLTEEDFIQDGKLLIGQMEPVETLALWRDYNQHGMGTQEMTILKAERRRIRVLYSLMGVAAAVALAALWMIASGSRGKQNGGDP